MGRRSGVPRRPRLAKLQSQWFTEEMGFTLSSMDTITLADLEVWYHVGVPDEERSQAQRLHLSLELGLDFRQAAATDDLNATLNYFALSQRLLKFGDGRSWKLIETLAVDLAEMVVKEFRPAEVTVEVKKFILPTARHVAVRITRRTPIE